jgi:shikimate kinase
MKIIIINGPTGIGKSTISRMVHQDLPLSLFVFLQYLIKRKSSHKVYEFEKD